MHRAKIVCLLFVFGPVLVSSTLQGQSPTPIVVDAATTTTTTVPAATAPAQDSALIEARFKVLEEMKATNDEILAKQKATLQRLEELEQAAEQLKAYSKRG